jgi:hypothetical protein
VYGVGAGVGQPEGSSTTLPPHGLPESEQTPSHSLHCRDGWKPRSVHCLHKVKSEHGALRSGVGAGLGIGVGGLGDGGAVAAK